MLKRPGCGIVRGAGRNRARGRFVVFGGNMGCGWSN